MTEPPGSRPTRAATLVGWRFLLVGAVAFGGLGTALDLIRREFVEGSGWLTELDVAEALAFTKPLPGSTVVQVVSFLGWRLGRLPGALVASVAFVLPSAVLMTGAAAGLAALPASSALAGALSGVQVVVVGLLASATVRLGRSEASGWALRTVLVVAFAVGLVVNAAVVVVGAAFIGALAGLRDRG